MFSNTVEFDFGTAPQVNMLIVQNWVRSLGVPWTKLHGIMPVPFVPSKMVRMKFKISQDYQDFMEKYEGFQALKVEEESFLVSVREAGTIEKYVRIHGLPFEATESEIRKKFGGYGKITSIRREKYMSLDPDTSYFPIYNGVVTLRMAVKTHIPSLIMLGGIRIQVSYQGQPATCFKCGETGHIGSKCQKKKQPAPHFPGKWAEPRKDGNLNKEDTSNNKTSNEPPPAEITSISAPVEQDNTVENMEENDKEENASEETSSIQTEVAPTPAAPSTHQVESPSRQGASTSGTAKTFAQNFSQIMYGTDGSFDYTPVTHKTVVQDPCQEESQSSMETSEEDTETIESDDEDQTSLTPAENASSKWKTVMKTKNKNKNKNKTSSQPSPQSSKSNKSEAKITQN